MKKLLPPTLFIICIAIMVVLWWLFPIMQFVTFPASLVGILPFLVGIGIAKRGSDFFEKKGTNIETFDDPDVLVTDGLYQISRNPMYLGFLIALFGVFILFGCLSTLFGVVIFFAITDRWYIVFEEAAMAKAFGDEYAIYKTKIRRWM